MILGEQVGAIGVLGPKRHRANLKFPETRKKRGGEKKLERRVFGGKGLQVTGGIGYKNSGEFSLNILGGKQRGGGRLRKKSLLSEKWGELSDRSARLFSRNAA